jgi:putative zinc finger/helix-turn-helix YgiT family protein
MECLKCNNTHFLKKKIRFNPTIKDETVEVIASCFVCSKCHEPLMNTEQMNFLRNAAANKYRQMHGLLTSIQIISYRKKLGMSQSAFARYLNVGEASIKRWETYFIQESSQDELVRLKCDEALAEMNYLDIYTRQSKPDTFNGNRRFDYHIVKNIILYILKQIKTSKLFLNKILFYADFLHFKKYQIGLTGIRYKPLKYGPCPDRYDAIYANLINKKDLHEDKKFILHILNEADSTLFDDNEKETLNHIISICKKLGTKKIYELAHKEKGYTQTDECSYINYTYSKYLKISS